MSEKMPAQQQEKPGLESKMSPRPAYRAPGYHGSSKLIGKVALITGGDSGIGRAVAVLFAREIDRNIWVSCPLRPANSTNPSPIGKTR